MTSGRSWGGKRLREVEGPPFLVHLSLDLVGMGLSWDSWETLKRILRHSSPCAALQIVISGNKDLPAEGTRILELCVFSITWLTVMASLNDSCSICNFSHKVIPGLWTETWPVGFLL